MTQTKARVFVKGPAYAKITEAVFKTDPKNRYEIVSKVSAADIVVFTGGEDINPALYGERPIPGTYYTDRDLSDLEVVDEAYGLNKFMVGICRGAQLLNVVPNGGKLWQDVDGHGSAIHQSFDCLGGNWVPLNSVHHQMMRLTEDARLLTWAQASTIRQAEKSRWTRDKAHRVDGLIPERDKDVEACYYDKTRSLCTQFHPEFGHPPTTKYFHELMNKIYFQD